jgi:hypothetical protein
MKTFGTIIFIGLLGIFGTMWFFNITDKTYNADDSSLSFSYSPLYFLDEAPMSGILIHLINLTKATPENELFKQGKGPAEEGPVSIDIKIYQKTDSGSLDQWLTLKREDSWSVSRGVPNNTSVSGFPALSYKWSGLYEGDAIAVNAGSRVYIFTVTYMTQTDPIRKVFSDLLKSVKITEV